MARLVLVDSHHFAGNCSTGFTIWLNLRVKPYGGSLRMTWKLCRGRFFRFFIVSVDQSTCRLCIEDIFLYVDKYALTYNDCQ